MDSRASNGGSGDPWAGSINVIGPLVDSSGVGESPGQLPSFASGAQWPSRPNYSWGAGLCGVSTGQWRVLWPGLVAVGVWRWLVVSLPLPRLSSRSSRCTRCFNARGQQDVHHSLCPGQACCQGPRCIRSRPCYSWMSAWCVRWGSHAGHIGKDQRHK